MPEQVVADGTMGGWSLNRSISVGEVLRVEKVCIRFPRVVFSSYDFFFFLLSRLPSLPLELSLLAYQSVAEWGGGGGGGRRGTKNDVMGRSFLRLALPRYCQQRRYDPRNVCAARLSALAL